MNSRPGRRRVASRVIAANGVLLLVLGAIHLVATPLLKATVLDPYLTGTSAPIVTPPFLLNHVVVGILLFPLGVILLRCAPGIREGERWAWDIARVVSVAMLGLPIALLAIMSGGFYDAPLFRIAEGLVLVIAANLPATLVWCRGEFRGIVGPADPEGKGAEQ